MAEIRIPRDRIPAEVLQLLQTISQNMILPVTSMPPPSCSPTPASTVASSTLITSTPSSDCISFSETTSSFSTTAPLQRLPKGTVDAYGKTSQEGATQLQNASDEVDGAPCESSIVHALSLQRERKSKGEVLDDSDIVRIFPEIDEECSEEVDTMQTLPAHQDAEIVRIFPDNDERDGASTRDTSFRSSSSKLSSSSTPSSHSECIHVFGNSRQTPSFSNNVRKLPQTQETHSPSFITSTPQKQQYGQQIIVPSPRRFSNQSPSHFVTTELRSETVTLENNDSNNNNNRNNNITNRNNSSQTIQRQQSPKLPESLQNKPRQVMKDSERSLGKFRQTPSIPVSARPSPELPTPPQTPDDADNEDDEVFSYDVFGNNDDSMSRRAFDAYRQSIESTPRRDSAHLRRNSDRSLELRHEAVHRSSPFSPSQKLSELSFGDRLQSRKRLSFDEEDVDQSTSPGPHFHSDPSLTSSSTSNLGPPLFTLPQTILPFSSNSGGSSSNSHCFSTASLTSTSNLKYRAGLSKSLSPAPMPRVTNSDTSPLKSQQLFHQSYSSSNNPSHAPPSSPFHSSIHQAPPTPSFHSANNNQLPIRDVINMIERASNQHGPVTSRLRLHSDGDDITDGQAPMRSFYERGSPSTSHTFPRRQTFSYGKRRRMEEESYEEYPNANQMMNFAPRDQANEACQDCTCAAIERHFLQMAECAYKKIRRMDSTPADFDRFRNELAQTNDILRESLTIMKHFKSICEHTKRSSTASTETQ